MTAVIDIFKPVILGAHGIGSGTKVYIVGYNVSKGENGTVRVVLDTLVERRYELYKRAQMVNSDGSKKYLNDPDWRD